MQQKQRNVSALGIDHPVPNCPLAFFEVAFDRGRIFYVDARLGLRFLTADRQSAEADAQRAGENLRPWVETLGFFNGRCHVMHFLINVHEQVQFQPLPASPGWACYSLGG